MNQSTVWEQECERFFNTTNIPKSNKSDNRFKQHFHNFTEIYGDSNAQYYKRVTYCWKQLHKYLQTNLPEI